MLQCCHTVWLQNVVSSRLMEPRRWKHVEQGQCWSIVGEGSFGNEFPLIRNHCGVMVAWSRKTLKKKSSFAFVRKTTPYGKIFKLCSERIHCHTDRREICCSNFVKFGRREMGKILPLTWQKKQNFAWLSSSRYCAWTSSERARKWIQYSAEG